MISKVQFIHSSLEIHIPRDHIRDSSFRFLESGHPNKLRLYNSYLDLTDLTMHRLFALYLRVYNLKFQKEKPRRRLPAIQKATEIMYFYCGLTDQWQFRFELRRAQDAEFERKLAERRRQRAESATQWERFVKTRYNKPN